MTEPTRHGDRVDEIIFALHIVVADAAQQSRQQRTIEAHHAGIAEIDVALGADRILALDDLLELAILQDEAAVRRRIGGAETQHADRSFLGSTGRKQGPHGRGRYQRRVAEHHQHRPAMALERTQRRLGRVPGAERLGLDHGRMRCKGRRHRLGARGHDTDYFRGLEARGILQHVPEHRPSGEWMQNLRKRRFHARSGPGRQNHHGNRRFHG